MSNLSSVEEIKSKLNLLDIVQEHVRLKPAGSNWKGLCPFHHEKTPSFMVSPDKQIWHCFGCGLGGDLFSFIQQIEGVEFPEALETLAKRTGVQLTRVDPAQRTRRQRLADANRWAMEFWHQTLLKSPQAEAARRYLVERQVRDETVDELKLGFAIDSWNALGNFLRGKGFADQELLAAGLLVPSTKGQSPYDRFRGRLMFPLEDHQGVVVGFTGRLLPGAEGSETAGGKYVNTPQSELYDKSRLLYGLYRAKNDIREQKFAIVVEGNMDWVSSYQAGVKNAVAVSGTALTDQQLILLKRYCGEIALCFDADAAGRQALQRGLDRAWLVGFEALAIRLPTGKDPDECIRTDPQLWLQAVAARRSILDHLLQGAQERLNPNSAQSKRQAAQELLPLIIRLPDPIVQTHYLQALAKMLNVSEEVLRQQLPKVRQAQAKDQPMASPRPQRSAGTEADPNAARGTGQVAANADRALAERVLALGLATEQNLQFLASELPPEAMPEGDLRSLYSDLISGYTTAHSLAAARQAIAANWPEQFRVLSLLLDESGGQDDHLDQELVAALGRLQRRWLLLELGRVSTELRVAEAAHDRDRIAALTAKNVQLTEQLSHYQSV